MIHILLVEDNAAHAELIRRAFEPQADQVRITVVSTLQQAYDVIRTAAPALIISDLRLPDGDGIELLPAERSDAAYPVVIMTSFGDEQIAVEAIKAGALDYVVKSEETLREMPRIAEHALREWTHILERKRAEHALRQSEERYALAARGANDGLWDWELSTDTVYFSPRWKQMLGWAEEEIGHSIEEWFQRIHPADRAQVDDQIAAHIEGQTPHFQSEYRIAHKDQTYRWMLCRGIAVRSAAGQAYRMAGSQTDITGQKLAEEKLFYAASHDALTDLVNRALFLDHLEQTMQRRQRYHDALFAVLFLDLDHFKIVNDSLGHQVGDQLLIEFSRRLKTCVRPTDTVARLGGDEFTLLLDRINTVTDVLDVVRRIQSSLQTPFDLNGHEVFTTVSIGIACGSPAYQQAGEVLRDADTAMYRAKNNGRARYEMFDQSMHTQALDRLQLEADLRRGIERQEFVLHYQPIIAIPSSVIVGVEVLLRWQHPQRGLIAPITFIPLAEETGLIVPLSAWLMRTAFTQAAAWQQAGYPAFRIAVNLSPVEFKYPDLSQRIGRILQETGMAAQAVEIEITETLMMDNLESTLATLHTLHQMGLNISIDDFGTGYSSLGRLKHLPINTLKIDRSFIQESATDPDDAAIIKAILAMARSLNLDVIAEGVETQEQLWFLREQHCAKLQGYLFSRPIPAEHLTMLLQKGFRPCKEAML